MIRQRFEPTWPFLCILICLFVLSATSPSLWERTAKGRAARREAALQSMRSQALASRQQQRDAIRPEALDSAMIAQLNPPTATRIPSRSPVAVTPSPLATPGVMDGPQQTSAAIAGQPSGTQEAGRRDARTTSVEPPSEPVPAVPAGPIASQVVVPDWAPVRDIRELENLLLPSEPLFTEQVATDATESQPAQPAEGQPQAEPGAENSPQPNQPAVNQTAVNQTTESQPAAIESPAPQPSEPAQPEVLISDAPEAKTQVQGNGLWQEPVALVDQLEDLSWECETGGWARDVHRFVRKFGAAMDQGSDDAASLLGQIEQLRQQGETLAAQLGTNPMASKVRRVGFALDRRLVVWKLVVQAGGLVKAAGETIPREPQRLALCVTKLDSLTKITQGGKAWAEYLALDDLRDLAQGKISNDEEARNVARIVLERLNNTPMNRRQREFLATQPLAALKSELARWAAEPIEFRQVLRHLEQFEQTGGTADARLLAEDCRRLALSQVGARRELAQRMDLYYRNANVRVAVAGELLNRMIPERPPEYAEVNDVVLGNRVHGQRLVSTKVGVRLIPDPQRVRVALEINGLVSSLTHSTAGPATFYNDSEAAYRAWKEIDLGRDGMRLKPADVAVSNDLRLRSLSTDFDAIPLVNIVVQEVARSQHEMRKPEANSEIQEKVYAQAKKQIDEEGDARLKDLATRLEDRVVEPLAELALGPAVINAETTDRRVVMRLRLGAEDQLGGYTPRPMAPADSVASIQLHESALNNVVGQLKLDGGTFTVPQLRERIAACFHRPEMLQRESENEDVTITFAPRNAIQVRCQDGQVTVILTIAQLSRGGQTWDDFQVRACYRPEVRGLSAFLVRDDVIQLLGDRVRGRSQIALRGIFSRVFSKDQPLPLMPAQITKDKRLAGIAITQLVVEDGWIGLALGEQRPGRAPIVVRRDGADLQ